MDTGLNIAILDNKNFVSLLPNILKEFNIKNIELPVQLWQKLELDMERLNGLNISGLSGLLSETDIFPMSIFATEKLFTEQVELLQSKLEIANKLKCKNMSLSIDPFVGYKDLNYAEELFIDRVRYCAVLAKKASVTINLEYISHNVAFNNGDQRKFLFCDSIDKATNLIDKIAFDNVNLLLDLLHWYCDEHKPVFKDFASYIGFVHICDHKEKNYKKIDDYKRVLPGEGVLPIEPFINCLKYYGYKGPSTIEVFRRDEYHPSNSAIKQASLYINKLWSKEL